MSSIPIRTLHEPRHCPECGKITRHRVAVVIATGAEIVRCEECPAE